MEATSSCGVADSAGGKFLDAQVAEPVKVGTLMLSHPIGEPSGSEWAQTPPSSELSTLIGEIMESPGLEYPDPFDEIMEEKEQPAPVQNSTSIPSPQHTHAEPSLRFTLPPPTLRIPPPVVNSHDAPTLTTYSPVTEEMPRISHYKTEPTSRTSFHFAKDGTRKVPKSGTSTAAAMKVPADAVLLQNPYPNPHVNIRLCMRNGCGSILTDPHAAFCQRCVDGGFVTVISKHYRNKPSRPSNHYRAPKPGHTTSSVTPPTTPSTSRGPQAAPQSMSIPLSRVESRPGVVAAPCQPIDTSRSLSSDQLPLNNRSLQQPFDHQSAQRRITAPVARKCAASTCDRPVDVKARAVRCASCIKADWKTKIGVLKNTEPITRRTTPHVKKELTEASTSVLLPTPPPTATSPCAASDTATRTSVKRKLEHTAVPTLVQHSDTEDDDISSASRPVSRLDLTVGKGNEDIPSGSLSPAPMSTAEPPSEFAKNDSEIGDDKGNHHKPAEEDPPLRERLFIRLPARPPNPKKRCNIPKCRAELEDGYKWKLCRACRDHHRAYQRGRLGVMNPSYTLEKERTAVRPSAGSIRLYASSSKQRICGFKGCGVGLPPIDEYKYKMCRDCRRRTTNSRRRRTLRESGQPPDHKLEEEKDRLIAKWRVRKKAVLDDDLEEASEQENEDDGMSSEDSEGDSKAQRESELGVQPPALRKAVQWERPASLYPEYPTLPTLLVDFSARISSFFKAHRAWMASQSAMPQPQPQKISTFGFNGEFSTINMNTDIVGRSEPVIHYIEHLKGELVRAGRIQLDTEGKQVAFAHGGILTRYRGAQWIGESWMTGEMEIAILPDTSHPYLQGQRTIIRYRLVNLHSVKN